METLHKVEYHYLRDHMQSKTCHRNIHPLKLLDPNEFLNLECRYHMNQDKYPIWYDNQS